MNNEQDDRIAEVAAILGVVCLLAACVLTMIKMDIQETDRLRAALPTATVIEPLTGPVWVMTNRDLSCSVDPCDLGRAVQVVVDGD